MMNLQDLRLKQTAPDTLEAPRSEVPRLSPENLRRSKIRKVSEMTKKNKELEAGNREMENSIFNVLGTFSTQADRLETYKNDVRDMSGKSRAEIRKYLPDPLASPEKKVVMKDASAEVFESDEEIDEQRELVKEHLQNQRDLELEEVMNEKIRTVQVTTTRKLKDFEKRVVKRHNELFDMVKDETDRSIDQIKLGLLQNQMQLLDQQKNEMMGNMDGYVQETRKLEKRVDEFEKNFNEKTKLTFDGLQESLGTINQDLVQKYLQQENDVDNLLAFKAKSEEATNILLDSRNKVEEQVNELEATIENDKNEVNLLISNYLIDNDKRFEDEVKANDVKIENVKTELTAAQEKESEEVKQMMVNLSESSSRNFDEIHTKQQEFVQQFDILGKSLTGITIGMESDITRAEDFGKSLLEVKELTVGQETRIEDVEKKLTQFKEVQDKIKMEVGGMLDKSTGNVTVSTPAGLEEKLTKMMMEKEMNYNERFRKFQRSIKGIEKTNKDTISELENQIAQSQKDVINELGKQKSVEVNNEQLNSIVEKKMNALREDNKFETENVTNKVKKMETAWKTNDEDLRREINNLVNKKEDNLNIKFDESISRLEDKLNEKIQDVKGSILKETGTADTVKLQELEEDTLKPLKTDVEKIKKNDFDNDQRLTTLENKVETFIDANASKDDLEVSRVLEQSRIEELKNEFNTEFEDLFNEKLDLIKEKKSEMSFGSMLKITAVSYLLVIITVLVIDMFFPVQLYQTFNPS